ncbi:nucleoprotein [Old schoolhouse virus 2]|uniref:Nucleoprotein n=2 Tax=Hartmanivirus scholae TaxID=3052217 RepID=A0A3S8NEE1_9VIRU|nr:nucleoprotein [Old schoolhouse virus 1]AZI72576.1 nucleoprotein [Old schoolhouse virus 1]AZI72582.1 nucleoprotein [Old schoolhouse virus 2]
MAVQKDLIYESIKELHGEFGIKESVTDELKKIWDNLDGELIQKCNLINSHFKSGGDSQGISEELLEVNKRIRNIHSDKFVESSEQIPVVVTTENMSLNDLIELKNDVDTIRKKNQSTISGAGSGTVEGWNKFIESSAEDLILFIHTGFLDEKFLRKQGSGKLAGYIAKQHGMTKECKKAAIEFKTVKEDIFDYEDSTATEILTNQLQVDYLFLIVFICKKQSMTFNEMLELCTRCKMLFNKLPFTKKVYSQLLKSSKYPALREIEDNLKLYDSPFRTNRARFQSAVSAITGCVSDRMISSELPSKLLSTLIKLKHRDGVTVNTEIGSTSTYELLIHSTLTTPSVNSKLRNRTNVRRNGLNTVKFIQSEEISVNKHNRQNPPSTKNVKERKIKSPKSEQHLSFANEKEKAVTGATKISTFVDIEGSASEPNEVAITSFFTREGNYWMREAVFFSSQAGKDYLQQAQYCNGINLEAINELGLNSRDIFFDAQSELDNFKSVYFFGSDINTFLNLCSYKGNRIEINLPEWRERKEQGYICSVGSIVCNKSVIHNLRLKAKPNEMELKQLPHCASEDNMRLHNFVVNSKPSQTEL